MATITQFLTSFIQTFIFVVLILGVLFGLGYIIYKIYSFLKFPIKYTILRKKPAVDTLELILEAQEQKLTDLELKKRLYLKLNKTNVEVREILYLKNKYK